MSHCTCTTAQYMYITEAYLEHNQSGRNLKIICVQRCTITNEAPPKSTYFCNFKAIMVLVDLNEFSFCFLSAAFSLQTPENNLKHPYNPFKRQIDVRQWFTTRGSFVNKPMVKILGASQQFYIFQFFFKIWMVSDKMIHRAFRIHKKQSPLEKFFILTIY